MCKAGADTPEGGFVPDSTPRIAVVTGAAGALGQAMSAAFLANGYVVAGFDLPEALVSLNAGVTANPHFIAVAGDVTDEASIAQLAERLDERFGRLDVIVNNAAIDTKVTAESGTALVDPVSALRAFTASAFTLTLSTNVVGPFLVVRACLPLLQRSQHASIVNIASIYGVRSPNQDLYRDAGVALFKGPDYPVSKAALVSLSDYFAATLGHLGIRSNAVSPGGVDLGLEERFVEAYSKGTPLRRMATPADVVEGVLYLASPASGYVTGHNLLIDGGRSAW
jgi:NAD(P)-dependent dehydrogenase (short-subunit alcohol dehydrogenase family)